MLPALSWCPVPAGSTVLQHENRRLIYNVQAFRISQYLITINQFQEFVDSSDGYINPGWWDYSRKACEWRRYHTRPLSPHAKFGDHPRTGVSWYDAIAYCRWVSDRTGLKISLPTEAQWKRAAQGDDNRLYPWGSRFDSRKANTLEAKIRTTTDVRRYAQGASPYGVMDMAGNTWEWCRNARFSDNPDNMDLSGKYERALRGGSYRSQMLRARTTQVVFLIPTARYGSNGFRVVAE